MTKSISTQSALPSDARLSINRCNLPADVLGDLSFQSNPKALYIDGVAELHNKLFNHLNFEISHEQRARIFIEYMNAHFCLSSLDNVGYDASNTVDRSRANYLRVLRGWYFDSDSLEGAVIKLWVESRFGLIPRYHQGVIHHIDDTNYARFLSLAMRGLYNTNALEAQLDLLYSYCQYELTRRFPEDNSIVLYRGQNELQSLQRITHGILKPVNKSCVTLLLNNINSFSENPARASEFGDSVISTEVPFSKLLFFSGLMPGLMTSEKEYSVIGGVYQVNVVPEIATQPFE